MAKSTHESLQNLVVAIVSCARELLCAEFPADAAAIRSGPSGSETELAATMSRIAEHRSVGSPPGWYRALTDALDVAITMDKVRRSLELIRGHTSDAAVRDSDLLDYHVDAWIFHARALCDKVLELLRDVYVPGAATFLTAKIDWSVRLAEQKELVRRMAAKIDRIRTPLAHKRGSGVTAMEEDVLWDPFVVLALTFDDILDGEATGTSARRADRHSKLRLITIEMLKVFDSIFQAAAQDMQRA